MPLVTRAFPLHRLVGEVLEFATALPGLRGAGAGSAGSNGVAHESSRLPGHTAEAVDDGDRAG